ncbi:hypothetical protein LCGC14_2064510 [marine sediment metagenome]|uniref:AAA+ ATPase domain-containing protein n=1 Tax=marine sediment metagenome TaxID=412755 RepID=A0A0F9EK31_9ZZZZ
MLYKDCEIDKFDINLNADKSYATFYTLSCALKRNIFERIARGEHTLGVCEYEAGGLITPENHKVIVDLLCEQFGSNYYKDESVSDNGSWAEYIFCNENSVIRFNYKREENSFINLITSNQEEKRKLFKAVDDLIISEAPGSVYMVMVDQNGLRIDSIGFAKHTLNQHNYSKGVVSDYNKIVQELSADEPRGRFAILSGPPGTGKTHLIKAMLNEVEDSVCILLPAQMVSELSGPQFVTLLVNEKNRFEGKHIILILEDADACLVPRGNDNISTISSLLNITDGIFGLIIDIRVVATTNAEKLEFDKALIRPSRIISNINVGLLTPKEATDCYKNITGKVKEFDEEVTLAEIYSLTHDNENYKPVRVEKSKMGFNTNLVKFNNEPLTIEKDTT